MPATSAPNMFCPGPEGGRPTGIGTELVCPGGQREFAVGADPKRKLQAVEFEPAHPHVEPQQRKSVEADAAARRIDHRPALGIADRQAAEADADAVRSAHDRRRPERDLVAGDEPALQVGGNGRLQRFQADRATAQIGEPGAGQHEHDGDEQNGPADRGAGHPV